MVIRTLPEEVTLRGGSVLTVNVVVALVVWPLLATVRLKVCTPELEGLCESAMDLADVTIELTKLPNALASVFGL